MFNFSIFRANWKSNPLIDVNGKPMYNKLLWHRILQREERRKNKINVYDRKGILIEDNK